MKGSVGFDRSVLEQVVRKHGGDVPNYNIQGEQHFRLPTKDQAFLLKTTQPPPWKVPAGRVPVHASRSELLASRRAEKYPDLTYDVDGDGGVGPADYFISEQFSKEKHHHLTAKEKGELVKALEGGFLDKYSFGHEQAGVARPFPVVQKNGKIVTVDNAHEVHEGFPAHPVSSVTPRYVTAQDMRLQRAAARRNFNNTMRIAYDEQHPRLVPEQPVPGKGNESAHTVQGTMAQKKEAHRQEARDRVGLVKNPAPTVGREHLASGLGYREEPRFRTRTDLQEARQARFVEELQAARERGEEDYIPTRCRYTIQDHRDYEQRRPDAEAMTLTKLRHRRKVDGIEHNMANFGHPGEQPVGYEAQGSPWWTLRPGYVHEPAPPLRRPLGLSVAELTGKVTACSPVGPARMQDESQERRQTGGSQAFPDGPASELGAVHALVGRELLGDRAAECLLRFPGRQRRVSGCEAHGAVHPPVSARDSEPLHCLSSFQVIKEQGVSALKQEQLRLAQEDEQRAREWASHAAAGSKAAKDPTGTPPEALDPGAPKLLSEGSSHASLRLPPPVPSAVAPEAAAVAALTARAPPVKVAAQPGGADLPMTARLGRLAGQAGHSGARAAAVSQASSKGQDEAGPLSPAGSPAPYSSRAAPFQTGMAVREGGFQWLAKAVDPRLQGVRVHDAAPSPLPGSSGPTPRGSRHVLGPDALRRTSSRPVARAAEKAEKAPGGTG